MTIRRNRGESKLKYAVLLSLVATQLLTASQDDIFTNVKETRRKANAEQHKRAISLGGCAGTLIAPNIALSAAHCKRPGSVKSGVSLAKGGSYDGDIGKTLEVGKTSEYDYWIFEIEWDDKKMPEGMKVVPLIQTKAGDVKTSATDDLDKIYALGFPGDVSEGDLYISEGFGKGLHEETLLLNNISLINGNSGGPVMRASDHMLVSVVSGGPHRLNEKGFKENDPQNKEHWNWGPALYLLYEKSETLKKLFPQGHNTFDSDLGHFNQFDLNRLLVNLP